MQPEREIRLATPHDIPALIALVQQSVRILNARDYDPQALEAALWSAARSFKEQSILAREIGKSERARGQIVKADRFDEDARVTENYSEALRKLLLGLMPRQEPEGEGTAEAAAG